MGIYSEMDADRRYGGAAFEPEEEAGFDASAFEDCDELDTAPVTEAAATPPQQTATQTAPTAAPTPVKESADKEEEAARRKAHEEAEAKRKAEWDARQAAKKAAEEDQLAKLATMSDQELMMASMQRIGADTERLTRRNMKECVSEHIQTMCLEDPAFARKAMHPKKSMIHCIWYINRKAKEFVEQEMKDNDIKPERNGIYGSDVPDDLCYQWAADYFNDPDAEEDHRNEEKFVPKPYNGKTASKSAKSQKPKPKTESKTKAEPSASRKKTIGDDGQMSLLGAVG